MSSELRQRKGEPKVEKPRNDSGLVSESDDPSSYDQGVSVPVKKSLSGRIDQFFGFILGDGYQLVKHPHTITWLILFLTVAVTYFAFIRKPGSYSDDIKAGITLVCIFFVIFGAIHFPASPLIRPHPSVWKAFLAISLLYEFFLLFLLCLTTDNARQFLKFIDPALGVPLHDRDYANDCRIYTPDLDHPFKNVRDIIYDEFFLSHLLGWIAKAFIFRDWGILWILSIFFEVLEVSTQHILYNFQECWWDKMFADVFGCNFIGMAIGMWIVKKLQAREYHWVDYPDIPNNWDKFKRIFAQFTPMSVSTYKWNMFGSFSRYVQCCAFIGLFELVEMDAFFLKSTLWLEPPHYLNVIRLLIWASLALSALTELYDYMNDSSKHKRLGTYGWTAIVIAFTEFILVIKNGKGIIYGENIRPMPTFNKTCWILFFILNLIWFLVYMFLGGGRRTVVKTEGPGTEYSENKIIIFGKEINQKIFFAILPLPLLAILVNDLISPKPIKFD